MSADSKLLVRDLGRVAYDDAMAVMHDLHVARVAGAAPDALLILEHDPPVITKGRRLHDVAIPREGEILKRGIQIRQADRGGLLTSHAPGQIVAYFVLNLEDYFSGIGSLVQALEGVLLGFLARHGVTGRVDPDHPGIWVGHSKIASLGLRVEQGVTKHGISLNVSNDLDIYGLFDPCGLSGNTMTTMEIAAGTKPVSVQALRSELAECFRAALAAAFKPLSAA